MAAGIPNLPQTTKVLDERGFIGRTWLLALQDLFWAPAGHSVGLLANIPGNLKKADKGYTYEAVDFAHTFEWAVWSGTVDTSGTAVTWTGGDLFSQTLTGKIITIQGD